MTGQRADWRTKSKKYFWDCLHLRPLAGFMSAVSNYSCPCHSKNSRLWPNVSDALNGLGFKARFRAGVRVLGQGFGFRVQVLWALGISLRPLQVGRYFSHGIERTYLLK
jgi:hypothetical protein